MKRRFRTTSSSRFIFASICGAPLGLAVSGCENLPAKQAETVKAGFAEKESCGEVTVVATPAPDWLNDRRPPPPPPEIAADPTRSAIYYRNHTVETYPGGAQFGALKAHRVGRAYIEATSEVGRRFVRR